MTPRQYAQEFAKQVSNLFNIAPATELVIICQVIHKSQPTDPSKKLRTDKTLTQLNEDIDLFNHEVYRLTRKNHLIVRWRHTGMLFPEIDISTDGTHPNTGEGIWKYARSISSMCKRGKEEMLKRRMLSKNALRRKEKKTRVERKEYNRKKRVLIKFAKAELSTSPEKVPKVKSKITIPDKVVKR